MTGRFPALVIVALLSGADAYGASDHAGRVVTGRVPIPGATVVATQGDTRLTTTTDADGVYRFTAISDGTWTIHVDMLGFAPATREITTPQTGAAPIFDLPVLPFEEVTRGLQRETASGLSVPSTAPSDAKSADINGARRPGATANDADGFRRADVLRSGAPVLEPFTNDTEGDAQSAAAADGFLINGSVLNGAASPFAQLRAFGNNRPGQRSLYNGGIGFLGGTSAWDARPFSFSELDAQKPSYNNLHFTGTFGGPLKIPGVVNNRPIFFVGAQRTANIDATAQSALLPSALERLGDFSQTFDSSGQPVRPKDPLTGQPFVGGRIPLARLSPQALALLSYYPQPNIAGDSRYNYQFPVLSDVHQDNVQARLTQPLNRRNQLFGTFAYQRTSTDSVDLFEFADAARQTGIDTAVNWNYRFSPLVSSRVRYQLTRVANRTTPYFANRTNVSGLAGISGNNQDQVNWGPPSLSFSSGLAGLSDALPAFTRNETHAAGLELYWFRGRHSLTFGTETRRHRTDIDAQQDPRGAFAFTGAATGSDLADFLLGIPSASTIAFGNADKYLRGISQAAYVSDDWRVSPTLTINAGVRWEYESPLTERFDRLVNLDVSSDFSAAVPVLASAPVGALTKTDYPPSLLHADRRGIQPRVGVSWRPVPGSSLVVRGGYGIYQNQSVYQSIATQLAQQPPLSNTFSSENIPDTPLTLANGFVPRTGSTRNTFAVDPEFRVGYAHNWQVSLQRDLPASLTTIVSYLGTRGSHLMQQSLPNTFPLGAFDPCPSCPSGFVFLTSNGHSSRHAGQVQLRRRLRNGLSATLQYTLSKAMDDAAALGGASPTAGSIAQDWRNLDAEWASSNFDQRHLVTAQFEYTTGVGTTGGGLLNGWKGRLWKNWMVVSQLTAGSGLPLTPIVVSPLRGTGIPGTTRADAVNLSGDTPEGYYFNPAAYAVPAPGSWGSAGRNSITGPRQFLLNAGVARTFPWGSRLSLDWRLDALNALNRVTYSSVSTVVGSPQFGLPNRANVMRKLQSTLRLRF